MVWIKWQHVHEQDSSRVVAPANPACPADSTVGNASQQAHPDGHSVMSARAIASLRAFVSRHRTPRGGGEGASSTAAAAAAAGPMGGSAADKQARGGGGSAAAGGGGRSLGVGEMQARLLQLLKAPKGASGARYRGAAGGGDKRKRGTEVGKGGGRGLEEDAGGAAEGESIDAYERALERHLGRPVGGGQAVVGAAAAAGAAGTEKSGEGEAVAGAAMRVDGVASLEDCTGGADGDGGAGGGGGDRAGGAAAGRQPGALPLQRLTRRAAGGRDAGGCSADASGSRQQQGSKRTGLNSKQGKQTCAIRSSNRTSGQ